MSSSPRQWLPAYLGTSVAWGCSFIFIKEGLTFLTPFGVAFGRCFFGAVTLFIIARATRNAWPRDPVVWAHLAFVALLINVLPGILFAVAETHVTSILAGIANALTPLTTLFFMTVVFRDERLSREQLLGLVTGLIGVLVVFGAWHGLGHNPWWAVGALLLSVVLYGVTFPYTRRYLTPRQLPPTSLASAQLLLAAVMLTPTFFIDGMNGHGVTWRGGISIILLGILGSGLAFMWNFKVINLAGSSVASTVTYLSPLVAVVVGVVVLRETLTWYQPVGGFIVLVGAALGQGRFKRRSHVS
jgi:drug/metabolite transporter (DMT)-like permease